MELPAGWAMAPLSDLVPSDGIFTDGDWVESKDQDPEGYVRLTQLADVGVGLFRDRSKRSMTVEKADELRCTLLQEGDILVARMPDPLGRACLYPGSKRPAVTVVDVCVMRTGRSGVNNRWLMWAINSPQVRQQIHAYQTGTTRKRISRKNLGKVELAVPPLAEQYRIVEALEGYLSRLDAASANVKRCTTRIDHLWRSMLNNVAEGVLPERRVASKVLYVSEVAEVSGGIQKQKRRIPIRNAYPFLRVANVARGKLDLSDIHEIELFDGELEKHMLERGDLLVVEGNGSPDQIGRAASWDGTVKNVVHQNHLIRVRPGGLLIPRYLELIWNSPLVINQLREVARSTSGLYTLSTSKVKAVKIPVPSLQDQMALVESADVWETCTSAARSSLQHASARSKSLHQAALSRAFTGHLVPQDPADEPAYVLLNRIRAERGIQGSKLKRAARLSRKTVTADAPPPPPSSSTLPPIVAVQQELPL